MQLSDDRTILRLVDVRKTYDAFDGLEAPEVLRGVSLDVSAGESVAIVGPSGSGKSTLLNIVGSLDRPSAGQVVVAGKNLADMNDDALARFRSREVGFVFQLHHLLPQCTVLENVLLPTLAAGRRKEGAAERAKELLRRVGLSERMHYRPSLLSGGERQRAAVVRALINQPKLLLADEPTGSLDRASAEALGDLLVQLNRERGVTLVVVTHSDEFAGRMARRYALRDGVLSPMDGPP
jgi:lipoprotein-releasing system ATP-binding protein